MNFGKEKYTTAQQNNEVTNSILMSFRKESERQQHNEIVKQLYETYAKKLLAYTCKNYTIDKDDAWAIVYKTIYKIADVKDSYVFDIEQKLSAFIFKTHINYLRNYFRDNKSFEKNHYEVDLTDNIVSRTDEDERPIKNLPLTILQQELDKLEDWQRILLLMRGQDIPYSKISEFVNKPENQLKTYYARLKKQLMDSVNAELEKIKTTQNANQ